VGRHGFNEQISGADEQVRGRGQTYLRDIGLTVMWRRLDEIERKLDRIVEELRMPTAIGYSVRRGNLPRKD